MQDEESTRSEHLWQIANIFSSSCPAASRFYMCNFQRNLSEAPDLLKMGSKYKHQYCKHCGSLWSAGDCRVRVLPRPSLNRHMKTLLKLEAEQAWRLNNHQKNKLKKFKESTNRIVYSCVSCGKKTIYSGDKKVSVQLRDSASSSTPFLKIKKGDLNAGLFIPSACAAGRNQMNGERSKPIVSSQTPDTRTPLKCKTTNLGDDKNSEAPETPVEVKTSVQNKSFEYQMTPSVKTKTPKSTISSAQKKSNAKKRKTLLDQILKQEQNSKKKTSLSSFLVSLS